VIAYQTAYMKANYSVEFMTAVLTAESIGSSGPAKDEKLALAVDECRRLGIIVLPPDINRSQSGFTIEEDQNSLEGKAIRFGLSAIKNVGEAAIGIILSSREIGSDFKSLSDFCQRVDAQKVNKKVLESLIKAGAMDAFGKRAAMLSVLDQVRSRSASLQKQKKNGQVGLFDNHNPEDLGMSAEDKLPEMEEFTKAELLTLEKNLLGFYLTEHPLAPALSLLDQHRTHKLFEITQGGETGKKVVIGGMITDLRIVITRRTSREMAFVKVEDDTASLEVVVFPKIFASTRQYWAKDQIVLIEGKVESREEAISLIVDSASLLSEAKRKAKRGKEYDFEIKLPSSVSPRKLVELNRLFKQSQGQNRLCLVFVDSQGRSRRMVLPYGVDYTEELAQKIKEIIE